MIHIDRETALPSDGSSLPSGETGHPGGIVSLSSGETAHPGGKVSLPSGLTSHLCFFSFSCRWVEKLEKMRKILLHL